MIHVSVPLCKNLTQTSIFWWMHVSNQRCRQKHNVSMSIADVSEQHNLVVLNSADIMAWSNFAIEIIIRTYLFKNGSVTVRDYQNMPIRYTLLKFRSLTEDYIFSTSVFLHIIQTDTLHSWTVSDTIFKLGGTARLLGHYARFIWPITAWSYGAPSIQGYTPNQYNTLESLNENVHLKSSESHQYLCESCRIYPNYVWSTRL